MTTRRLAISFSGGETSARMTHLILSEYADRYDEIVIVFMNTSDEREESLIFVDRCDREIFAPLGHRVIWLEAVPFPSERKASGFRITDFAQAKRDGSVYESVIQKYGIPNKAYPHCNRELKLAPFTAYLRSIGWAASSYDVAIGIRADEIDRMALDAEKKRIVYPLVSWRPMTKPDVNTWFRDQPFRLELAGYQGNCKKCFKKSFRKLYTIVQESPETSLWYIEMEARYGTLKGDPRVFFRSNTCAVQVLHDGLAAGNDPNWQPASDDSIIYNEHLDTGGSCDGGESCEPFATDGGEA